MIVVAASAGVLLCSLIVFACALRTRVRPTRATSETIAQEAEMVIGSRA